MTRIGARRRPVAVERRPRVRPARRGDEPVRVEHQLRVALRVERRAGDRRRAPARGRQRPDDQRRRCRAAGPRRPPRSRSPALHDHRRPAPAAAGTAASPPSSVRAERQERHDLALVRSVPARPSRPSDPAGVERTPWRTASSGTRRPCRRPRRCSAGHRGERAAARPARRSCPRRGSVRTRPSPPSCAAASRTTSSPTPRPATSVTVARC